MKIRSEKGLALRRTVARAARAYAHYLTELDALEGLAAGLSEGKAAMPGQYGEAAEHKKPDQLANVSRDHGRPDWSVLAMIDCTLERLDAGLIAGNRPDDVRTIRFLLCSFRRHLALDAEVR
jgi:hypothetical protein